MKRLTITYGGLALFDADVDELVWQDSPSGVSVTGKPKRVKPQGSVMEMISQASRRAEQKKDAE